MNKYGALAAVLYLASIQTCFAVEELPRLWNSADGKHSTKGHLIDFVRKSKTVTIKKDDDQIIEIDFGMLSKEDQRYVNRFQAARTKKAKAESLPVLEKSKVDQQQRKHRKRKRVNLPTDVVEMYGVSWIPSIDKALVAAAGTSELATDDRPVMWFRVLGDLAGYM